MRRVFQVVMAASMSTCSLPRSVATYSIELTNSALETVPSDATSVTVETTPILKFPLHVLISIGVPLTSPVNWKCAAISQGGGSPAIDRVSKTWNEARGSWRRGA